MWLCKIYHHHSLTKKRKIQYISYVCSLKYDGWLKFRLAFCKKWRIFPTRHPFDRRFRFTVVNMFYKVSKCCRCSGIRLAERALNCKDAPGLRLQGAAIQGTTHFSFAIHLYYIKRLLLFHVPLKGSAFRPFTCSPWDKISS